MPNYIANLKDIEVIWVFNYGAYAAISAILKESVSGQRFIDLRRYYSSFDEPENWRPMKSGILIPAWLLETAVENLSIWFKNNPQRKKST